MNTLQLPELLTSTTGRKITTAADWQSVRRPELLELFRTHVYGRTPTIAPQLSYTVDELTPNMMDGAATRKLVTIHITGPHGTWKLPFTLFVPRKKPAPAFVYISIGERSRIDPTREVKAPQWPVELIIERGFAAAAFQVDDLSPNIRPGNFPDFTKSIHGLFDAPNQKRPADAWATIGAWAWGASRILDYLQTDADIAAKKVAVVGHSRAGKTALWASAQDERFAMAVSVQSGCTGAALARMNAQAKRDGVKAETIADITHGFPFWFCDNYKQYANNEDALPLDQHMLIALTAPRKVYVSSATEDLWCCPESEYAALQSAAPAWHLYNQPTNLPAQFPAPNSPLHTGPIAHHLRPGPHGINADDWTHFLNFFKT